MKPQHRSQAQKSGAAAQDELAAQLHNLPVLTVVAALESIARAADRLHKAPSAISRSVIELEKAIGHPLFERKPRGMLASEYGKAVVVRANRIQSEIEEAAAELARFRRGSSKPSTSTIANYLLNARRLDLVTSLAASRNMSATATQLGISSAGGSMALTRLEQVIGQKLFERRAQGFVETEAAAHLVIRAKRVFAEIRHMLSDISAIRGNVAGSVVIGTLPLGRTRLVPRAITKALQQCPGLQLTSIEGPGGHLIRGLRAGEIDIFVGVLREAQRADGVAYEKLFSDSLSFLVRKGHPVTRRKALKLSDLLSEQWLLPDKTTIARRMTNRFFEKNGVVPPLPSIESSDLAMIREILSGSDIIAVTTRSQMMVEIDSGALIELPLKLAGTARDISLIIREGAMLSPAAKTVLDAIRLEARNLRAKR